MNTTHWLNHVGMEGRILLVGMAGAMGVGASSEDASRGAHPLKVVHPGGTSVTE